jgi:hypothetical protein
LISPEINPAFVWFTEEVSTRKLFVLKVNDENPVSCIGVDLDKEIYNKVVDGKDNSNAENGDGEVDV